VFSVSIRRPANRYVLLKRFNVVIKEFSSEAQQFPFTLKVRNGHSANVADWKLSICEGLVCEGQGSNDFRKISGAPMRRRWRVILGAGYRGKTILKGLQPGDQQISDRTNIKQRIRRGDQITIANAGVI
jgi:hypothetical protein